MRALYSGWMSAVLLLGCTVIRDPALNKMASESEPNPPMRARSTTGSAGRPESNADDVPSMETDAMPFRSDSAGIAGAASGPMAEAAGGPMAGAAGGPMAGAGSEMVLGPPCKKAGELGCDGLGSRKRLRCDGSTWVANGMCGESAVCRPRDGQCVVPIEGCDKPGKAVCVSSASAPTAAKCSADLVSVDDEVPCTGDTPYCSDGRCQACDFPSQADKLSYSGFDSNIQGWTVSGAAAISWAPKDATNCSTSGALQVTVAAGKTGGARRCISVPEADGPLRARAHVMTEEPQASGTQVTLHGWQGANCSGTRSAQNAASGRWVDEMGEWAKVESVLMDPAVKSVEVQLIPDGKTWFDQVWVEN